MVESLRDRLWSAVLDANTTQCWVRDAAGYDQATETVDAVLAELEAAGYRVVPAQIVDELFERAVQLQRFRGRYDSDETRALRVVARRFAQGELLAPGDLDD